ncbi:unnamed protein product [Scytosiphon promiscuus]
MQRERERFPPISTADDAAQKKQKAAARPRQPAPKFEMKTAEEAQLRAVSDSIATVSGLIRRVENALEGGAPYLGTNASEVLFQELSALRREKTLLLEKDVRLQQRTNLLLTRAGDGGGGGGRAASATASVSEDERILHRVDSFSILIVVSTLVTGFSIPALEEAQLGITRTLMTLVFALEMFATIFFSIISFYAKQAFNYGSSNNQRTARFLYHVRWVTFSAQACYTLGILLFVFSILLEATLGYETFWALIGVVPILMLGVLCWVTAGIALISLRMGRWMNNLLVFDAETKLVDEKRSTFIPAPTSFAEWLGGGRGIDGENGTRSPPRFNDNNDDDGSPC